MVKLLETLFHNLAFPILQGIPQKICFAKILWEEETQRSKVCLWFLPKALKRSLCRRVSVAQLDRARASDARCRWFESSRVHHKKPKPIFGLGFFVVKTEGELRSAPSIRNLKCFYKPYATRPDFSRCEALCRSNQVGYTKYVKSPRLNYVLF